MDEQPDNALISFPGSEVERITALIIRYISDRFVLQQQLHHLTDRQTDRQFKLKTMLRQKWWRYIQYLYYTPPPSILTCVRLARHDGEVCIRYCPHSSH